MPVLVGLILLCGVHFENKKENTLSPKYGNVPILNNICDLLCRNPDKVGQIHFSDFTKFKMAKLKAFQ